MTAKIDQQNDSRYIILILEYTIDTLNDPNNRTSRPKAFTFDPNFEKNCQQLSTKAYESVHPGFDRGHLAPSSHMSLNKELRKRANYMTNIVPQAKVLNEGIWKTTGKYNLNINIS